MKIKTKKLEIITKVVNNEMTRKEARFELCLSRKQIYRLIIKFNDEGKNGFIHKMNKRFSYAIDEKTAMMRENAYAEEELKIIISDRKVKL